MDQLTVWWETARLVVGAVIVAVAVVCGWPVVARRDGFWRSVGRGKRRKG